MREQVEKVTVVGEARGLTNLKSSLDAVADAQAKVAVSGDRMTKAQESAAAGLNRAQRAVDASFRSAQMMEMQQKRIDQALAQGLITQGRHAELLQLAAAKYQVSTTAANANSVAMARNAAATKQAAFQSRMLLFQLNDIGVSLASGMNPLMVMVQQGSQISQIYAGQGGVNAALRQTGAMLGGAAANAARFSAALLPVSLGAMAGFSAIRQMQGELDPLSQKLVAAGQDAIGFGDVVTAAMQVAARGISEAFKAATAPIAPYFSAAYDTVIGFTKDWGNNLIRLVIGAYDTIVAGVDNLPDAFIVAGEAAANGFLSGIEWMVKKAMSAINKVLAGINSVARKAGLDGFDMMPELSFSIGRVDIGGGAAADRIKKSMDELDATATKIMNTDYLGQFYDATKAQVAENAMNKLAAATENKGGATKKAKEQTDKLAESYARIVRDQQQFIDNERMEAAALGMTEREATQLRIEKELLNKALDAGIKLTAAQVMELHGLASASADAAMATERAREAQERAKEAVQFTRDTTKGFIDDLRNGLKNGEGFWDAFKNAALNALDKITDRILNQLMDAIFQLEGAMGSGGGGLLGMFGSMLGFGGGRPDLLQIPGLWAKGGAFNNGNVIPFARGGVVNSATMFPLNNGRTGVMGEAGPEAIMPLRRGPNGSLGVQVHGQAANQNGQGGTVDVRVYMDDNGNWQSQVERISGAQIRAYDRNVAGKRATASVAKARRFGADG